MTSTNSDNASYTYINNNNNNNNLFNLVIAYEYKCSFKIRTCIKSKIIIIMITQSTDILYGSYSTSRRKSKTIIFSPYIQVSFIISTSDCENLKVKLIFLDRIVAKLFPVRKSLMQFGNSHQCTNSL